MIGLRSLLPALQTVNLVLAGLLLAKTVATPALRHYRFFAIYLALDIVKSLVLLPINPRSKLFGDIYFFTAPLVWIACLLAISELYSLVLDSFKGIASASRWVFFAALGTSLVFSALSVAAIEMQSSGGRFPVLAAFFAFERGILSAFVLLLVLITAFLIWFPVPLSRNVILHTCLFFVYFLSNSLVLITWKLLGPEVTSRLSVVLLGISSLCFLIWLKYLTPQGEQVRVQSRPQWKEGEAERVLAQLDAINASLSRSAGKT